MAVGCHIGWDTVQLQRGHDMAGVPASFVDARVGYLRPDVHAGHLVVDLVRHPSAGNRRYSGIVRVAQSIRCNMELCSSMYFEHTHTLHT